MVQDVTTRSIVVQGMVGVLGLFSGIWSFWKTLLHHKPLGAAGFVIVIGIMFTAIFAPLIAPDGINDTSRAHQFAGPSMDRIFGSDHLGRDLFSRVVWGSRGAAPPSTGPWSSYWTRSAYSAVRGHTGCAIHPRERNRINSQNFTRLDAMGYSTIIIYIQRSMTIYIYGHIYIFSKISRILKSQ